MKILGTIATFVGAVTLMLAILVAQHDYQDSWDASAVMQTTSVNQASSELPVRLAQANN
jgi:hypothetical protein